MRWQAGIKVAWLLAILALALFEFCFRRSTSFVWKLEDIFLSLHGTLLLCLMVWCGALMFLTYRAWDWPLTGFLLSAVIYYLLSPYPDSGALLLVASVGLGKGARFFLIRKEEKSGMRNFLPGVVGLLAFASWWHLDMSANYYHGPRWMGLWDNPNTYGLLMAAGVVLAAGLLWERQNAECKMKKFIRIFLFVAVAMMGVGLVMSYSRGAWLAAGIGLLYLAWSYGKLKWRYVGLGVGLVALGAGLVWGHTPDSAAWYVKRADLGRPSAQHRATAWRAGLEIMRDHPLGVGWNNAVKLYEEKYHPPEGGPAAIITNDYLMIGTELGVIALLCFAVYCALCLRGKCRVENEEGRMQAACRAGAIVFLVAFWFDGGLFKLPTAALFWVLLELGNPAVARPKRAHSEPS